MESIVCSFQCRRCGENVVPAQNVGKWKCTYHPGSSTQNQTWSCCNRKVEMRRKPACSAVGYTGFIECIHKNGCVPCDHSPHGEGAQGVWEGANEHAIARFFKSEQVAIVSVASDSILNDLNTQLIRAGLPKTSVVCVPGRTFYLVKREQRWL